MPDVASRNFFGRSLGGVKNFAYICSQMEHTSLHRPFTMARARVSINPLYNGGAGGYTFYARKGEQVIRQRKNNSNYGDTASRTEAQQRRRVKWANLVNLFKDAKGWMPKAYESKKSRRTDYNEFMSINIGSSSVCLTKDQAANGCAVIEPLQVSLGSLPPITTTVGSTGPELISDIKITAAISASTTIAALSADIIANNPQFKALDNIALISWSQFVDSRSYPYVSSVYTELTLDPSNTSLLSTLEIYNYLDTSVSNFLSVTFPGSSFGSYKAGVFIHTRQGSPLLVSSQRVVVVDSSVIQQFSGYEWEQTCIKTYGVDGDVPLDPSFNPGVISQVTANGAQITPGATLQGQQTIRVYGSNLYGDNFQLIADNVPYVPLESTNEYIQFTITDNVDVSIKLNGRLYLSFRVDGIERPDELTGTVGALLRSSGGQAKPNSSMTTDGGCLNYPRVVDDDYQQLRVYLYHTAESTIEEADVSPVNCTITQFQIGTGQPNVVMTIIPEAPGKPCYLIYDGFIFFVGNYNL